MARLGMRDDSQSLIVGMSISVGMREKKPATHSCRGLLGSGLSGLMGLADYGTPMVTVPPQGMMFIFLEMVPV